MRISTAFAALFVAAFCLVATSQYVAALPGVDVSVTKAVTSGAIVDPGDIIQYNIIIRNNGDDAAPSMQLVDNIPAGTTFVSFTGGCCGSIPTFPPVGGTGTITAPLPGPHAKGAFTSWTLRVRVNCGLAAGTIITNTATGSSPSADPLPANNSGVATTSVSVNTGSNCGGGGGQPPISPTIPGSTDVIPGVDRVTYQFFTNSYPPAGKPTVNSCDGGTTIVVPAPPRCNLIEDIFGKPDGSGPPVLCPAPFPDTPVPHPYEAFIKKLAELRITRGCATCEPPTRTEFGTFIKNTYGLSDFPVALQGERAACFNPGSLASILSANSVCNPSPIARREMALFIISHNESLATFPSWGPSVHIFDNGESLNGCLKNLGISPLQLPQEGFAPPVQYHPLNPSQVLPFLEKLFCGTNYPSLTRDAIRFTTPSSIGGILNLNLGTTGAQEGSIGSFCWITPPPNTEGRYCDPGSLFGDPADIPNVFGPSCPMLTVIPQIVSANNIGQGTADVRLNIDPSDSAALMQIFRIDDDGTLNVVLPPPAPSLSNPSLLPAVAQGSGSVSPAVVASATNAVGPTGRGASIAINGMTSGQSSRFLVFSALPLPVGGTVPVFTVTVSSPQDSNLTNNSMTMVAETKLAPSGPGNVQPKPVIPQVFQNPGAIIAVQPRPKTPTPTVAR